MSVVSTCKTCVGTGVVDVVGDYMGRLVCPSCRGTKHVAGWQESLAVDDSEVNFRMREDGTLLVEVQVDESGSTVTHELNQEDQRNLREWLGSKVEHQSLKVNL